MDKAELLQAFEAYLEESEPFEGEEAETDLHTLFTEMAALRNEVKTESRQFKSALEDFNTLLATLQGGHDTLRKALDRDGESHQRQLAETQRGMLLELLELHDRLRAGLAALDGFTPGFWSGKTQTAFIDSIREGQQMTVRRLDQLLSRHQVEPIPVLDQPLDPHCMKAVETAADPHHANGWVVAEIRRGFRWQGQMLRVAEVQVNKLPG